MVGEIIKACREVRGISQNALMNGTGIPQTRLSRIESGKSEPRIAELQTLCRHLKVRMELVLQMIEYEKKIGSDASTYSNKDSDVFELFLKSFVQIRMSDNSTPNNTKPNRERSISEYNSRF